MCAAKPMDYFGIPLVLTVLWTSGWFTFFCGALVATLVCAGRPAVGDLVCTRARWLRLALDIGFLVWVLPGGCCLLGVLAATTTSFLFPAINTSDVARMMLPLSMISVVFVIPVTPYVWPLVSGRAEHHRAGTLYAFRPRTVAANGVAAAVICYWLPLSNVAQLSCLFLIIAAVVVYRLIYKHLPRFVAPGEEKHCRGGI